MKMYNIPKQPFKGRIDPAHLPVDSSVFYQNLHAPITAEIHYPDPSSGERKFGGTLKNPGKIQEMLPFLSIRFPQFTIVLRNLLSLPAFTTNYLPLLNFFSDNSFFPFLHLAGTISQKGGSIGYHLDNYHVFIFQVEGYRKWNIWNKNVLTNDEVASFVREDPAEAVLPLQKKRVADYVFTLGPGEFLFIPALFPHEGITTTDSGPSISLSYVYTALSGYKLLQPFLSRLSSADIQKYTSSSAALYQILHSLPSRREDYEAWLNSKFVELLQMLPSQWQPLLIGEQHNLVNHWLKAFSNQASKEASRFSNKTP